MAEVEIESFDKKFAGFHALKMSTPFPLQFLMRLRYMRTLLNDVLNGLGIEENENKPRNISRALCTIFYNICDFEMKLVYEVKKSEILPEFNLMLNGILDSLRPYDISSNILTERIRTMDNMEVRIHEMYYGMIHHRLKLLSMCLTDDASFEGWEPPAAEFVNTYSLEIKTVMDYDLVIICKRELVESDDLDIDPDYLTTRKRMMNVNVTGTFDSLDWDMEEFLMYDQPKTSVSPASYIISCCNTPEDMLRDSEFFRTRVVGIEKRNKKNIRFIFLMCIVILDKSRSFDASNFPYRQVHSIFNIVFSVLNFILPDVHETYKGNESILIMNECTLLYVLVKYFSRYQFMGHQNELKNYVDILFKYVYVLRAVHLHRHSGRYYFFKPQKTVACVTRKFMPNKIGSNYSVLNCKFQKYPTLKQLLDQPEVKPICCVCGIDLNDGNFEKMAIPERCNHIFCTKCLMKNVNLVLKMKDFFVCPLTWCEKRNAGFILGKDYDEIEEMVRPEEPYVPLI